MKRRITIFLDAVILAVSFYLLGQGFLPPRREVVSLPLLPPTGMPSLPDGWQIRVDYSPTMRAGETQTVELNLTREAGQVNSNLIEGNTVFVEARLEMPFADVRPENLVSTVLSEAGQVTFYWELQPRQAGLVSGTVWLYLVPGAGSPDARVPVYAHTLEVHSKLVWGMNGSAVRVAGAAGFLLGVVISLLIFAPRTGN